MRRHAAIGVADDSRLEIGFRHDRHGCEGIGGSEAIDKLTRSPAALSPRVETRGWGLEQVVAETR
jgi:hypothetical protein